MTSVIAKVLLCCCIGAVPGRVAAATLTFSGFLDDPANPSLVWSDLGSPLFGDDWEIANNVALYQLEVTSAGTVTFESTGFAAGGIDPYFTLFSGSGDAATFLDSNFDHAFSVGGDFSKALALSAGFYTLAIGAFANMSFAEIFGAGTLGDGFIQLGVPMLGSAYYEFVVTLPDGPTTPVPEPAALTLLLVGSGAVLGIRRRVTRRRQS